MKINKEQECYETETGTPTLTVVQSNGERMIPWHGFLSGWYEGARIEVLFQGWVLVIEGERLEALWEKLQLQDVRVLRKSKAAPANEFEGRISRLLLVTPSAD